MQEVDRFSNFLVVLVLLIAGGLVGVRWLVMVPVALIGGYFLLDFHAGSHNKAADMVNIILILVAVALGLSGRIL